MENQKLWKESREFLAQNSFGSLDMPYTAGPSVNKRIYLTSNLNPTLLIKRLLSTSKKSRSQIMQFERAR